MTGSVTLRCGFRGVQNSGSGRSAPTDLARQVEGPAAPPQVCFEPDSDQCCARHQGLLYRFQSCNQGCFELRLLIAVFASLFWFGASSPVEAHSPYFGQSERIEHPKFGVVTLAVLFGDGIFFADPSQVVAFDSEGYLLAATPQSEALLIHCDGSVSPAYCRIYDELRGVILEPEYKQWAWGRKIEEEGRPPRDAYPEYMDIQYGFSERTATLYEKFTFELAGVRNSPLGSALSVLWWVLAWSLLARPAWRWKRNDWQLRALTVSSVISGFLGVLAFIGMSFLAAYGWLLSPYSFYLFLLAFVLGALIAAILTRPKAVVQRD
ncbi:MAG: hypothetical protein ACU0A5_14670 [Salipiger marinus]|uniref:hypothetical protein n=1 Tax=Salipiger marinus TaxID=555512 RepID=UPI00405868CF